MAEINPYYQDIENALSKQDLSFLKGCRILVAGATGLIGGCLVDMLMYKCGDWDVYAYGRNEERARKRFANYWDHPSFHFIKGDITNPIDTDVCFDYIINAASNASPNFFKEKPVEVIKSNIIGTQNLVEYGLSHNMKRMLFVSSGEIYGEGDGKKFIETDSGYIDCATPRACYPSSKRAAETLCVSYIEEYEADIVIARPCHTYGPYFTESDNRVYAQFIRNLIANQDIILKSPGKQYRSWLYVVDCVYALLTILLKGEKGEAYNVADDNSNITILELAELLAKSRHKRVIFDIDKKTGNTTPINCATFSTEKIKLLGWIPQTSIYDGLRHTLIAQSAYE